MIDADPTITAYCPALVAFDAGRSYDPDGFIVKYEWSFGDGSGAFGPTVYHTFQTAGTYVVVLTVTDNKGAVGRATITIQVAGIAPTVEREVTLVVPGSLPGRGELTVLTPVGRVSVDANMTCRAGLLSTQEHLIIVENRLRQVVMLALVSPDGNIQTSNTGPTSTLTISPETTATGLIGLSPVMLGVGPTARRAALDAARRHPAFPRLVDLISRTAGQSSALPSEAYKLAAEISLHVARSGVPGAALPEFQWHRPRQNYDGPHLAAVHPSASEIYVLNPKSIYYGLEVRDYDTQQLVRSALLVPADWLWVIYRGPGFTRYDLGVRRWSIDFSKGNLDSTIGRLTVLANGLTLCVHIIQLVISISQELSEDVFTELANDQEMTETLVEAFASVLEDPSVENILVQVCTLLSNETFVNRICALIAKLGLGELGEAAAKLLSQAVPIFKAITLAMDSFELCKFAWDLATAVSDGQYNVQRARELTLIPKVELRSSRRESFTGEEIEFSAAATDEDGTIVTYAWTIDGRRIGETTNNVLRHRFDRPGTAVVEVRVTDNAGAWATAKQEVVIRDRPNQRPNARLMANPTTGTAPLNVYFDASASNDPDGRIVSYRWNFGDGSNASSTEPVITYIYTREGVFTATVTVVDDRGAEAMAQVTVTVRANTCVNRPSLWTDKAEYCIGQDVAIYITVSAPSYVDLWVMYPTGTRRDLFTNRPLDEPGRQYVVPAKAGEPVGQRTIYLKARACGTEVVVSHQVNVRACDSAPSELPNLVVKDFRVERIDVSRCPSPRITFSLIVVNKGSARSQRTRLEVVQNECAATWIETVWFSDIPELAPGDWIPLTGSVTYCNTAVLPAVTLVAKVDPDNVVREADERDNVATLRVENPCSPGGLPDLLISAVTGVYCDARKDPGAYLIFVNLTVRNSGTGQSSPTDVVVYFLNCYQAQAARAEVGPLQPGQEQALSLTLRFTCPETAGGWVVIRGIVDRAGTVKEANEENNVVDYRFHISICF